MCPSDWIPCHFEALMITGSPDTLLALIPGRMFLFVDRWMVIMCLAWNTQKNIPFANLMFFNHFSLSNWMCNCPRDDLHRNKLRYHKNEIKFSFSYRSRKKRVFRCVIYGSSQRVGSHFFARSELFDRIFQLSIIQMFIVIRKLLNNH